jgi:hypothetical protein
MCLLFGTDGYPFMKVTGINVFVITLSHVILGTG